MNRRTKKNYTAEKVISFLEAVKTEIEKGENSTRTFSEICKDYKFGQIALPALRKCGFIRTNGRGFENWTWPSDLGIGYQDAIKFIDQVDRLKIDQGKKYRSEKKVQEIQPTNVVSFKPSEPKKAVQAELPMHPVRLTLLNEIRNELNEIRLRLERIEDQIDKESVKKSAER